MLTITDHELARLRLECRKHVIDGWPQYMENQPGDLERAVDALVQWCLRPKPEAMTIKPDGGKKLK